MSHLWENARRFCTIVRDGSVDCYHDDQGLLGASDSWLAEAGSCGIRAVETSLTPAILKFADRWWRPEEWANEGDVATANANGRSR